jgi:hypothetical protein
MVHRNACYVCIYSPTILQPHPNIMSVYPTLHSLPFIGLGAVEAVPKEGERHWCSGE